MQRTTISLDPDLHEKLQSFARKRKQSVRKALNVILRHGFKILDDESRKRRFVVNALPLGLREGLDPLSFNKLNDELEVEATVPSICKS